MGEIRDALTGDLDAYLLDTDLFARLPGEFSTVYGRSRGRPARASTWFAQDWWTTENWLDMTAANVAMSVTRLVSGRISTRSPSLGRLGAGVATCRPSRLRVAVRWR